MKIWPIKIVFTFIRMGLRTMKVINLFAGPGAGKSTIRAELFSLFKRKGLRVEEVTEFAKDLTWDRHSAALSDQLFILANQNRRQDRLRGQVEWCVSDCPILLGLNYTTPDYLPLHFEGLARELWDTYENYNFFILRDKPYMQVGRTQSEAEAKDIDSRILKMLEEYNVPYTSIRGNIMASMEIYNKVLNT